MSIREPRPEGINRTLLRYMPPSPSEIREGAWAIVKATRDLSNTGHGRAVRWARGRLGLSDDLDR